MADVTDSKSVGSDTVWVRVPPSAPRRSKVRFAPASFLCLWQKKTPSARSLAPPFQLRPALLARSWQAALRAAFFSNRRSRGAPVPSRLEGPSTLLLLSNCDPLCWLAVGRPPCGQHSSPIGGLGGSPFLPGQRGRPLCSDIFCPRQKTSSARPAGNPPLRFQYTIFPSLSQDKAGAAPISILFRRSARLVCFESAKKVPGFAFWDFPFPAVLLYTMHRAEHAAITTGGYSHGKTGRRGTQPVSANRD